MLNTPPGRFPMVRRAERLDPPGIRQYRHHVRGGVTPVPPVTGEM
jgi:hypothetical protein